MSSLYMLTRECMDVGRRGDVQMNRELRLFQDVDAAVPGLFFFCYGLMGLFGMPPLLDAE